MAKDSLDKDTQTRNESDAVNEHDEVISQDTSVGSSTTAETPLNVEVVSTEVDASKASGKREIVKSASLVMVGNLSSSLLGMLRQTVIAATGPTMSGPFLHALSPTQRFYDLLVAGSVGGALIPTFNDYASPEKREELRRLIFTIVNLVVLITAVASIFFFFIAPWFVGDVLAGGFNAEEKNLTVQYSRIIFLALLLMTPFSVLQAALYARKEFGWAAIATTAFHIGIIVGAGLTFLAGDTFFGRYGLAFGVIFGACGEVALLLPGLRKQRLKYMLVLDLKHPAIRHILRLYLPIAISFAISMAFVFLDQRLASLAPCPAFILNETNCGPQNVSAMGFATTLIQFPAGLVAAALSFAILPTLTSHAREGDNERFKETLLMGIRLGFLLMIPAAVGLIVLQIPIIGMIFERGGFHPEDTQLAALALQNYAYQLPFLALDQLLISAFYARKNTIIPVAILGVSILGYLAVALPFWSTAGVAALALANSAQNIMHALVLLILLRIAIGPLHLLKMVPALCKIVFASAVMAGIAWGLQVALSNLSFFAQPGFLSRAIIVLGVGGLAALAYFSIVFVLKVEEVSLIKGAILGKLGKKS